MAKLITLGSGSSGNSYILECNGEILLLELGLPWGDILQGLDYNISNVVGCLVSHIHRDHSMSIPNAIKANLSVYSCRSVQDTHEEVKVLKTDARTRIGGFRIRPIVVPHSVQCYSFIIEHEAMGKLLFFTDCQDFGFKVPKCNHILAECNWDSDVVIDNAFEEDYHRSMHENHLEKMQTLEILKHNYNVDLQNIVLIHMSSTNICRDKTVEFMKNELGFNNIFRAQKGLTLELKDCEF